MSDNHVTFGQDEKKHFFQALNNKYQGGKVVYSVIYQALNERANEDWVVTIVVNGVDYTAGPMRLKAEAREAAAEQVLRAYGWL
ncbi:hypothetical protein M407DRAFT_19197 [Tulasnella calospora MUT 4182]|uniref:DRBM domain-containing protein n=1 Tax=Tulasnella calospora MUT 4182 TaxID=1051891 RepID=A0A0C3LDD0_9AGAM|nr:hypothetical protein M407DRAFT_19197 [Tulasnella calospora MUT 4182]